MQAGRGPARAPAPNSKRSKGPGSKGSRGAGAGGSKGSRRGQGELDYAAPRQKGGGAFGTGPAISPTSTANTRPADRMGTVELDDLNTKQLYRYWAISMTFSAVLMILTIMFDWNKFYVYHDGVKQTINLGSNAFKDFDNDNTGMRAFTTIWMMLWGGAGMYGLYEGDWKFVGAGALNTFICSVFYFIVVFLDVSDTLEIIFNQCEERRKAVQGQGVTFSCDYTIHVIITFVDILTWFTTMSAFKLAKTKTFAYRAIGR